MTLVALFAVLAALGGSSGPPGACAHRGDVRFFPENTLPAFTSAVAKGAHMIEFDVYLTSDGVPIIIHDNTLDRTTNGTGNVTAYSLEELRTLDAGAWFDPKFAGTRIPTLQETLAVIPRYILCNVHLKSAPGWPRQQPPSSQGKSVSTSVCWHAPSNRPRRPGAWPLKSGSAT